MKTLKIITKYMAYKGGMTEIFLGTFNTEKEAENQNGCETVKKSYELPSCPCCGGVLNTNFFLPNADNCFCEKCGQEFNLN
jgi:membrane protease subunit (stomatin/prohibitin family)